MIDPTFREDIRDWLTTRDGGLPDDPDDLDDFIASARSTLHRAYEAVDHVDAADLAQYAEEVATIAELLNGAELERDHRHATNLRKANEIRDQIGAQPADTPRPILDHWTAKYGHLLTKNGPTP